MFQIKKKALAVKDIVKASNGNFIVNGTQWINYGALRNALLGKGLFAAINTPFALVGCTLTMEYIDITEEHLANGPVNYKNGSREITFNRPGEKILNTSIDVKGTALEASVTSEVAKFIASGAQVQPQPQVRRESIAPVKDAVIVDPETGNTVNQDGEVVEAEVVEQPEALAGAGVAAP